MAKTTKRKNPAKKQSTSGVILICVGAIFLPTIFSNLSEILSTGSGILMLILSLFCIALGIYQIIYAKKIAIIDNMITGGVTKLDEIAFSSHMSYDKVCKIINKLIESGIYTDVYLDLQTRELVHKNAGGFANPVQKITCPNCHATTSTQKGVCEYCGASLQ